MAEDIAPEVMSGLGTRGRTALDVMTPRRRIGFMSLAAADVLEVIVIVVALTHGILLPIQDAIMDRARYIMSVIPEAVATVKGIGLAEEKAAAILTRGR